MFKILFVNTIIIIIITTIFVNGQYKLIKKLTYTVYRRSELVCTL